LYINWHTITTNGLKATDKPRPTYMILERDVLLEKVSEGLGIVAEALEVDILCCVVLSDVFHQDSVRLGE
jgi:hypothetical protein